MLLGTHPIPARSPAEREGQNEKEMSGEREGGRRGGEEEGQGVCGWTMGFNRLNNRGEETEKKLGCKKMGI